MFDYEQKTMYTDYAYKVPVLVEEILEEGFTEVFITKLKVEWQEWEVVGRKPNKKGVNNGN
jgi:hypothetical protein